MPLAPTTTTPPPSSASTTTTTVKSTRRIVSNASIADPAQDSAGGARVWASNERASDIFANNLIQHIISSMWPDGIVLEWVQGRDGDTNLVWNNKYLRLSFSPSPSLLPSLPVYTSTSSLSFPVAILLAAKNRDANAVLTMGKDTAMAKTDGSLQIQIPDPNSTGGNLLWNRQYYVVPLEVLPNMLSQCPFLHRPRCLEIPCTFYFQILTLGETILPRSQRKRSRRRNNGC